MFWLDVVVNVARPVDIVCCAHLEVPKSPIFETDQNQKGHGKAAQKIKKNFKFSLQRGVLRLVITESLTNKATKGYTSVCLWYINKCRFI